MAKQTVALLKEKVESSILLVSWRESDTRSRSLTSLRSYNQSLESGRKTQFFAISGRLHVPTLDRRDAEVAA